jgi:hypothetical protein
MATAYNSPLEALIAREGNYTGLPKIRETGALQFWPLKGSTQPKDQSAEDFVSTTMEKETGLQELVTQSEAILQYLMTLYLEKGAPYTAEPVRDKSNAYNDYRHLSRYEEWAQQRNMTDDQDLIDLLNDDLSDEEIEDGEGDYAA